MARGQERGNTRQRTIEVFEKIKPKLDQLGPVGRASIVTGCFELLRKEGDITDEDADDLKKIFRRKLARPRDENDNSSV